MTRINCGIPPTELTDKHLLAEHREIKRIPNAIKNGRYSLEGIPPEFKLGSGHVKFFYDKLGYLLDRYIRIYKECCNRGFNVTYYVEAWEGVPLDLLNDCSPSDKDRQIVRERIKERLSGIKYEKK